MNSETKSMLENAGIDVDTALRRMMNNEALLIKFLKKFGEDDSYENLRAAMVTGDRKAAFIAAHTLKGVAGNLGLDGVMNAVVPVVESLRNSEAELFDPDALRDDMEKVVESYTKAMTAIGQLE